MKKQFFQHIGSVIGIGILRLPFQLQKSTGTSFKLTTRTLQTSHDSDVYPENGTISATIGNNRHPLLYQTILLA